MHKKIRYSGYRLFSIMKLLSTISILIVFDIYFARGQKDLPQPCDTPNSEIYCKGGVGSLLHTVQLAKIYENDTTRPDKSSKTFVDQPIKYPVKTVLDNFKIFMEKYQQNPSPPMIKNFVDENFDTEGTEFDDWIPQDWKEYIPVYQKIKDQDYRKMAEALHDRWKELGRKINETVKNDPDRYSIIYLEKPFVVPGGRFRECYYWDSYWTILGLLVSNMHETAKGMLENFSAMIEAYGMIPNGNRVYYTKRSQPPLFIAMVDEYYKVTEDKDFVKNNINAMDKEFDFWMQNRVTKVPVNGKEFTLAHYDVEVDAPRPESYREDYNEAKEFFHEDKAEEQQFYINMKSGAESGWDYSTKWFTSTNGGMSKNLKDIQTKDIIPVELNSYLCRSARIMQEFYSDNGFEDKTKAEKYKNLGDSFQDGIENVLWNEEKGAWFDYDLKRGKQRNERHNFYPSNVAPLWADCYPQTKNMEKIKKVMSYLESLGITTQDIGIPTSFVDSGQQWDGSNAWPPLQEIVVTGLEKSGYGPAKELALNIVKRWVKNGYLAYTETKENSGKAIFFEKYDTNKPGKRGGGGEYEAQDGFGWTNGVFLFFLQEYGDRISSEDSVYGTATSVTTNLNQFKYIFILLSNVVFARLLNI